MVAAMLFHAMVGSPCFSAVLFFRFITASRPHGIASHAPCASLGGHRVSNGASFRAPEQPGET